MPTPVSIARQCLTDEAARALDDAVAVARRRSHAQTTSLHAVSALLALPSSTLRDACSRARSGAARFSAGYTPRLQFRALELSVGVSLDRLPSSKSAGDDEPPVSNSLMAAIKRSQANQRRHPENFHAFQQGTAAATSFLKVELKHFILSILDDPIVSRVFAEAGFRSCDVKLALLQPPLPPVHHRFTRPVFLCNFEPGRPDENCRRIAEVLLRKSKRNPLLMGVYAKSALRSFTETVDDKGRGGSVLGLGSEVRVVCLGKEIGECVREGGSVEDKNQKMGVRLRELEQQCEGLGSGLGSGVVVSFGEVEVFVGESVDVEAVRFIVTSLTRLLEICNGKVWLVGVAETSQAYSKFLGLFPNVENDWDLHLLTVTSATPSIEGLYSKSSLMGSFVPFGGFFSTPEIRSPLSCTNASFTRCDTCNEKCEQEVADIQKVAATSASSCSTSSPWLQKVVNVDMHRGTDLAKTIEENTSLNDKILGLQKKWNDICQRLHHTNSLPQFGISQTRSQAAALEVLGLGPGFKESSSKDLSHNESQLSSQFSYMPKELHSICSSKQLHVPVSSDTVCINTGTDYVPKVSETLEMGMKIPRTAPSPWDGPSPMANKSVLDHRSSSSLTPVTTDLGLGTLYTSSGQEPDTPTLRDQRKHIQHLSGSVSTDCDTMNENTSHQIARSSCSGSNFEGKFDLADFKSLNRLLVEKVGWQDQAIYAISKTLSLCKSGGGKHRGSHGRADIWFAFLGPDRLGKRKIASVLAESIFGNSESLITVDLGIQDGFYPLNSVFECQNPHCYDVLRRKTIVDYIAGELSKKPRSTVCLENVDKADFLVQTSLLQAVRTGKFPDSHGRVVSINHTIFILTSKGNGSFILEESKMFSEERVLEAKRCQMQLSIGHASEDAKTYGSTNVKVVPRKGLSKSSSLNKRKQADISDSKGGATCKMQKQNSEACRSYLDLNMPVEEGEEGINDNDQESESITENTDAWLSDFFDQIDEKVTFNPFNFDQLAEKVLKSIGLLFQRTFGSELKLEIDYEVITHILAAAWLSDKKHAVEHWLEHVLGQGFIEAQQKYNPAADCVVKLVNCESIFVEAPSSGLCLPAKINLD